MSAQVAYRVSTKFTASGTFSATEQGFPVAGNRTVTDSKTTPDPGRPRTDPIEPVNQCQGGEPGYGTPCSPIVINLGTGPYRLSGPDAPVTFDINGDGRTERITWTEALTPIAFLAFDRNANGSIDNGTELFGDATWLRSGERASNGFEALTELDSNRDRVVDRDDPVWPLLLLWIDGNHDGTSQRHEIQRIGSSRIKALHTDYHWTGKHDIFGNLFRYQSSVRFDHGTRPAYDIYFRVVD